MELTTAVIIATRQRPRELSNLLRALTLQTVRPDKIVVSACDRSDVEPDVIEERAAHLLIGTPGLTAQRNRALALVRASHDIVIFFDDDFIPSRFWIERVRALLAAQPDVGCVTGRVIIDGVTGPGLEWPYGQSLVDDEDRKAPVVLNLDGMNVVSPYGCNMAFRTQAIEDLWFDERLALYGWLEDHDFGLRMGARARTIWTDAVWGVHLGSNRGRVSGFKFGYSQVVNPWYLMTKGVMDRRDLSGHIVFGLGANAVGTIFRNSNIDRYGRLKGNIVGIIDIILKRWAPERIVEF
jgi:glycosyltransferase involved in cell wall biosynthesis